MFIYIAHTATIVFSCDGKYLTYTPRGQPPQLLYPGNYAKKVVNGSLAYVPRSQLNGKAAGFYFNLETLPSITCSLMHSEDDKIASGIEIATDAGNGYTSVWGKTVPTLVISKVGVPAGRVFKACDGYVLFCM
jgi:hypothetical protein